MSYSCAPNAQCLQVTYYIATYVLWKHTMYHLKFVLVCIGLLVCYSR